MALARRAPRLGLALGSGSARGWAHIGVLQALAEEGIQRVGRDSCKTKQKQT